MSEKPTLKLDWCSHEAARYAVEKWHYSRRMPAGKSAKIGAWEGGQYIGCVLFSRGGNNKSGSPYGLRADEHCELTRVALTKHKAPTSRVVAIAIRMLRKQSPGLRALVSYADPEQGHHGGIYQAMGWLYMGTSHPQRAVLVAGESMHKRSASARYGTASPTKIHALTGVQAEYGPIQWKHAYLYPLDKAMREQVAPLAKPYPKREAEAA